MKKISRKELEALVSVLKEQDGRLDDVPRSEVALALSAMIRRLEICGRVKG